MCNVRLFRAFSGAPVYSLRPLSIYMATAYLWIIHVLPVCQLTLWFPVFIPTNLVSPLTLLHSLISSSFETWTFSHFHPSNLSIQHPVLWAPHLLCSEPKSSKTKNKQKKNSALRIGDFLSLEDCFLKADISVISLQCNWFLYTVTAKGSVLIS